MQIKTIKPNTQGIIQEYNWISGEGLWITP